MRSVSRIKFLVIVLAAAIATVAMALPVCASPAPTETPTPYNDSPSPLYPTSINTALSVYYVKYQHQCDWTIQTVINEDGSTSTVSNRATSAFISITPSVDRMICARNNNTGKFLALQTIAFYDSSQTFITAYTSNNTFVVSGLSIPTNAFYFRISINASSPANSLRTHIRILISPEIVASYWDSSISNLVFVDYFWRDYVTVQNYMIYPNGKVAFTVTSTYAFDELYAEFRLTSSFYTAQYVSCRVTTKVKDGSYGDSYYPANYTVHGYQGEAFRPSIRSFYFASDYNMIYNGWEDGSSYDNPCTLLCHNNDYQLSGFTIRIPLNKPDGLLANSSVSVEVDSIYLDDYALVIKELSIDTANNIDLNLSQAVIPEPSFDISSYYDDAFADVDTTMALTVYGWFWSFPFIVSMTSIVAVIALISYILFGKKG